MAEDERNNVDVDDEFPNRLRILISTDNHLEWERDEIRRDDSFRTFDEVLTLARQLDVDLVLLGGDLFHDSRPSRSTIVKAIQILSSHCLSDNPIRFQMHVASPDTLVNGEANFLSPNYRIGMPVFTIHGNHDDPCGQGNVSAVDILSSSGLVNYFGKVLLDGSNIGNIRLTPIVLQKGDTSLVLYGMGNIRDERAGRIFKTLGAVEWIHPLGIPEAPRLLVLHQNRVAREAAGRSSILERDLPPHLDLVVWGHEHESRATMEQITETPSIAAAAAAAA
eukprot:CAMPEP_0175045540 /NCGR_PEP_ID=MMETSP0052_2-20121109/4487_1 /TAXON_ID=51329 ORGANISM="Polytomella parva, Strain SAG 63-3" /NCGR_SAMPLE_ID=MMETSP0052_2 /ASSEMBLY_ACC=CAM_ASM_000194 /LENGTH=278 /DNA_ID=CAMNT_0016309097 /DNA_START=87 /DNA_END=919 /DNA_ORIENTATION=+